MKLLFSLMLAIFLLSGCATPPSEIPTADVSPLQYKDYDCDDIANELERIVRKMNTAYMQLDKKASNDTTQATIGAILFWPTLFFLEGGDGPQAMEYSMLRGKFDALEQVSIRKKCSIEFSKPNLKEKDRKEVDDAPL